MTETTTTRKLAAHTPGPWRLGNGYDCAKGLVTCCNTYLDVQP